MSELGSLGALRKQREELAQQERDRNKPKPVGSHHQHREKPLRLDSYKSWTQRQRITMKTSVHFLPH